jgi:gliding motility-associated lipoprotein GldH
LSRTSRIIVAAVFFVSAFSCTTIDLYEKSVAIPGHAWRSEFKPSFTFTIKDTSSAYRLFVILRHTDRYNYNNIYLNLYTKQPGMDSIQAARYDLPLANENGWLGTGMDDIYEHRIPLTPLSGHFYFRKPGDYVFSIEQIMRENPLENILNIGLRIEKEP